MRFSMRSIATAMILLLSMGVARPGAQERHDGGDSPKEPTVGKVVWQYNTGG
jgi:hypothetical protein